MCLYNAFRNVHVHKMLFVILKPFTIISFDTKHYYCNISTTNIFLFVHAIRVNLDIF